MNLLHIVMGRTGDRDDIRRWPVHAYADAQAAEGHRAAAQAWAEKVEALFRARGDEYLSALVASDIKHPFDPGYAPDYTETKYTVESVPAGTVELDMGIVDAWSLAAPTRAHVDACVEYLRHDTQVDRDEVIPWALLKHGVDPLGLFEGQPVVDIIAARLPPIVEDDDSQ